MDESVFPLYVMLWLLIATIIVLHSWRNHKDSVGIVVIFIVLFGITHWVNALVTAFPWYATYYDSRLIRLGFTQALIGIVAFAVGTMMVGPLLWEQHFSSRLAKQADKSVDPIRGHQKLGILYMLVGLVSYFILFPYTANIQTLSAFVYSMTLLIQVGIVILFRQAIRNKQITVMIGLIVLSPLLPLYILIKDGFLSFGVAFLLFVFILIVRTNRMPLTYFIPLLIVAYLGVSFSVSYFGVRPEIRTRLWYQENLTATDRLEVPGLVLANFRLFDILDVRHLAVFDERFPYNYFTGKSIENIESGFVEYSGGQTIVDAFLMLIPRAIWPEKPFRSGGDFLVAKYTGIDFLGGTTSQPTPVMEFYINFGTVGVVVGFIIVGAILSIVDKGAAHSLATNNLMGFAFWIVPAYTLLQIENGLLMVIAGSVVGFVLVPIVNVILYNYLLMDERHRTSR